MNFNHPTGNWQQRRRWISYSVALSLTGFVIYFVAPLFGVVFFIASLGSLCRWGYLFYRDRIWRDRAMDNRAQSIGIARMFLSLLGGAVVYWVVDAITSPLFTRISAASTNATADTATGWFETSVNLMPIGFAVIAFFGLIILSVYQSGRV